MAPDNAAILFEDFSHGMARQAVIAKCGARPCPEAPSNDLLLCGERAMNYLGLEWTPMFFFNSFRELQEIVLILPQPDQNKTGECQQELENNSWQPVYIETPDNAFDFFEVARSATTEEAEKRLRDFEKNMGPEFSVYYAPKAFVKRRAGKAKTWDAALDKAGDTFLVLDLMATADSLKISFNMPNMARKNALRYGEMIKK